MTTELLCRSSSPRTAPAASPIRCAYLRARRGRRPRGARGADRRLPRPRAAARVRPRGVRGLAGARGVADGSGARSAASAGRGRRCCRGCATARGCSAPSWSRALAGELGVGGARGRKVAGYYHAMEQGTLPAAGVSDRVLEALGARSSARAPQVLRAAGRAARSTAPPPRADAAAFAPGRRHRRTPSSSRSPTCGRGGCTERPPVGAATRSTSCSRRR